MTKNILDAGDEVTKFTHFIINRLVEIDKEKFIESIKANDSIKIFLDCKGVRIEEDEEFKIAPFTVHLNVLMGNEIN